MKLGFLGGTFDPIHRGHLEIAQEAIRGKWVDRVYFIPTAKNPLKENSPVESNEARLDLIQSAIKPYAKLGVLDWELQRNSPSFTFTTVQKIKLSFPNDEIFWLIGDDQLKGLHRWHRIEDLVMAITFLMFVREKSNQIPEIPHLQIVPVHNAQIPISATAIRNFLEKGVLPKDLLPPEVTDRILEKSYYGMISKGKAFNAC